MSTDKPLSIVALLKRKHPDSQFGMKVLIDMKKYNREKIEKALKARAVKKGRKSKWRRR